MMATHQTSIRVYTLLKHRLLHGGLSSSAPINIAALSRSYETSPTPVREALLRLVGEGHVDLLPSGGFAVRTLDEAALLEEYRLAHELTRLIVRTSAAMRAQPVPLKAPQQADLPAIFAGLAAQTGSTPLIAMITIMNERLARPRALEPHLLGNIDQEATELRDVLLKRNLRKTLLLLEAYHRRREERVADFAALLAVT